ncbi:MAG: SAM-dependent methyltransferase [Solirubrobacterales bacterium]
MSPAAPHDRAPVAHFERLMRESPDPWGYASSPYEQAKYRRTLAALPERTGSTLELACSVGVFTAMLAPRCQRLLAVDFSPSALAQAECLLGGEPNVELRQAQLPEQTPAGPFDTIVCAEVLYYWSPDLVREELCRIEAALAPGGTLVAVHWRHGDPRRQLDGNDVHRLLLAHAGLRHVEGEEHRDYLLDVWERDER